MNFECFFLALHLVRSLLLFPSYLSFLFIFIFIFIFFPLSVFLSFSLSFSHFPLLCPALPRVDTRFMTRCFTLNANFAGHVWLCFARRNISPPDQKSNLGEKLRGVTSIKIDGVLLSFNFRLVLPTFFTDGASPRSTMWPRMARRSTSINCSKLARTRTRHRSCCPPR